MKKHLGRVAHEVNMMLNIGSNWVKYAGALQGLQHNNKDHTGQKMFSKNPTAAAVQKAILHGRCLGWPKGIVAVSK